MEQDGYIQIGVTALRDPATGNFLPAVPLYIKATEAARAGEERMMVDAARSLGESFKQYVRGTAALAHPKPTSKPGD